MINFTNILNISNLTGITVNKKQSFVKKKYGIVFFHKDHFFKQNNILYSKRPNLFRDGKISRDQKRRIFSYSYISFSLSFFGVLETIYLTISKLNGSSVLCSNQNCSIVLNSMFSYFLNIPLSSFGIFIYLVSCLQMLIILKTDLMESKNNQFFNEFFIFLPISLGFFSSYFIYILEEILKTPCPWCFLSIFFSGSILIIATIILTGIKNFDVKKIWFFFFFLKSRCFFNQFFKYN